MLSRLWLYHRTTVKDKSPVLEVSQTAAKEVSAGDENKEIVRNQDKMLAQPLGSWAEYQGRHRLQVGEYRASKVRMSVVSSLFQSDASSGVLKI